MEDQTNNNTTPNNIPPPVAPPPRKPMSLLKKIIIIIFGTVCLFGLWDTFFPSKNPPTQTNNTPTTATTNSPTPSLNRKTYTNTKNKYSVNYPTNLELSQETPYSILFMQKQKQPGPPGFPSLYISAIPDGFNNTNTAVYNFMPADTINNFYTMKDNETKQTQTGTNAQYWTFQRLAKIPVADGEGIVIQNNNVWEGGNGLKDRRIIVKKNGITYIIGSYYKTQQELDDFHNFLLSFKFLQ